MLNCPEWTESTALKYRKLGCWEGITFGEMLRDRADKYGNHTAVVSGDLRLTYHQLDRRADQLASGMKKRGIRSGDCVVVQLPNTAAFLEVIFALFRIGAVPIMALPSHRKSEISYFCNVSEAVAYIIQDHFLGFNYCSLAKEVLKDSPSVKHVIVAGEAAEFTGLDELYTEPVHFPKVTADQVTLMQLSGGSTGLPKLIPRTHDDYMYSIKKSVQVCKLDHNSVYLAVLPVAHNFPMSSPGVLGTLFSGGTVVFSSGPSPDEAFELIQNEHVTMTAVVPPIALLWLDAVKTRKVDLSSLQVLQVGGAKFSAEAARRVKSELGCTLQQVYGMAEGLVNYTRLDDPEEVIIHTQGRPMSEYDELRIVDENDHDVETGQTGQLLVRGPYTIPGYYKAKEHNAKAFTSDGFYRTGDLVRMTPKGNIVVEGRVKDQINRGGEKVAAEEVENHLLAHPCIHDAAVVAMPDPFLGERTCAYVMTRSVKPSASELSNFLKERGLATFKIPDRIEYVETFPKTALGKVSKKELRNRIAARLNEERKSLHGHPEH